LYSFTVIGFSNNVHPVRRPYTEKVTHKKIPEFNE